MLLARMHDQLKGHDVHYPPDQAAIAPFQGETLYMPQWIVGLSADELDVLQIEYYYPVDVAVSFERSKLRLIP